MKKTYIHTEGLNGKTISVHIYGKCFLILDCYGFGIESTSGSTCNRIAFYDGKFASDYKVNKTVFKFLQDKNIQTIIDRMKYEGGTICENGTN